MNHNFSALIAAFALFLLASIQTSHAAHHTDEEAILASSYGYIDAFYEADVDKFHQVMWSEFSKIGFAQNPDTAAFSPPMRMTMQDAENLIARFKVNNPKPADAPRSAEILHQGPQIATVKVIGFWGFDYLQLAKFDHDWKIVHVIWQTPPAK